VALLSLLAVGAFVAGLNNQLIGSRGLPDYRAQDLLSTLHIIQSSRHSSAV